MTSATLGMGLGVLIGGHFFEPPPPAIYYLKDNARIQTCFTPEHQCLPLILQEIRKAKREILVQAFSLTSRPLVSTFIDAYKRGVQIKILLDKTQDSEKNPILRELVNAGIPILIDSKPAIAHNKLIIIDGQTVIGGSYNYSEAAEYANTENVLILNHKKIVQTYRNNWIKRAALSRKSKGILN